MAECIDTAEKKTVADDDDTFHPTTNKPASATLAPVPKFAPISFSTIPAPLNMPHTLPSQEEPYIYYETSLRWDTDEAAAHCASACAHLLVSLDTLDKKMPALSAKLGYRLELKPWMDEKSGLVEGSWRLCLKLEAVAWFDWLRNHLGNDAPAIAAGRKAINLWRDQARRRPSVDPPTTGDPVEVREYCWKSGCGPKCLKVHPKHAPSCPAQVVRQDGPRPCTWCTPDELVVTEGSKTATALCRAAAEYGLCLVSRREQLRELLLCPLAHMVNVQFVKFTETWQCVAKVVKILSASTPGNHAVQGIAINFGKWETANATNKADIRYAVDCHAHMHLQLSRTAVDLLGEQKGMTCLRSRVYDPEDYLEIDASNLETNRILYLEQETLARKVDRLIDDVAAVKTTLEDLVKLLNRRQ